ncbi:MAG: auxin efflux carrier [Phycisphaerales bacterium]|nr:auxin efflux carrier [Phycisphaerales bacterium]
MLLTILLDVVGPIIVLIGIGAFLRLKFKIDLPTLSKLNIYFAIPAFIFHTVSTSKLPFSDMGGIALMTVLQVVTLGILIFGIGRLLKVPTKTLSAVALAVMFYNSSNYGLPLAELAYPKQLASTTGRDGGAVQAFVLMTQNLLTFTVGLAIASAAHSGFAWSSAKRVLRLPMLPALLCGIGVKVWLSGDPSRAMPIILAKPVAYIAASLVPLACATLGAQLAANPRWPHWRPVGLVMLLRLGFGPLQMGVLLFALHKLGVPALDLWDDKGWPAQLLILTAAVPTAVNTLLMTMELDGDVNLAADCVFWTTVGSCISIPLWLWAIWHFFGITA